MKVLIVNTFYYPNMPGGAEQSVKLLAEGLAEKGHNVAIYCIDGKNGEKTREEYNSVKVYRYNANKFNLYKFSYDKKSVSKFEKVKQKLLCYNNRNCVKDFEEVCKDFMPDVIHTNTTYGISPVIWKKASKMNIPVVHTVRDIGMISPVQYGHKVNPIIKKIHVMYMKHISKYVSGVTAPSTYTLNTTLEVGCFKNAKINKVIFNSVKINYERLNSILTKKREKNDKKIKFMYAGRLVYFKGIEHMIDAFELVNNEDCELHICGTGEMQDFVKAWTEKDSRIVYHGKLNNEQLANCYEDCDVLIVPSFWPEPFGRVLIEGNLYGLPVIAGNCGGMPEIIENTKAGLLYTPKNVDELVEKIRILTNRDTIREYFDNIERNINIYDVKYQINEFEKLYKLL